MDTSVQLFKNDQRISCVGLEEPSIMLIENDRAFSVLLAEELKQDSFSNRIHLEQVTFLRVKGKSWQYENF